jgi:hypothetical protein
MRTGGWGKMLFLDVNCCRSASFGGVPLKKSFAQKIFGSNLFLKNQKIEYVAQTQYAAISAAHGKTGNYPRRLIVTRHTKTYPQIWREVTDPISASSVLTPQKPSKLPIC